MPFVVKEIYYTLQGEGTHAGRPAVFCRFAGCNLWSGREPDRQNAICRFCDTEFVGTDGPRGGVYRNAESVAAAVSECWAELEPAAASRPTVVCTGGEPLLQLTAELVDQFHTLGFQVAVETNGTRIPPPGVDWVCVSPKAGGDLVLREADEVKLVFPQPGMMPEMVEAMQFGAFFLQPMDGPAIEANTRAAIEYCLRHPKWRLSIQLHKLVGLR